MLSRYRQLTPREREVMVLVAEGKTNKDVARRLDISHRTVEIHRRRVMEKLGAASVSDLVSVSVLCGVYELHVPNHQPVLE
ncbi:MAG TPA: LuxR family transcriptional regulator [Candidatus Tenderia sp.]|nr:LuxR family transcriptional regulator [Candidatus Tenderia sp.]